MSVRICAMVLGGVAAAYVVGSQPPPDLEFERGRETAATYGRVVDYRRRLYPVLKGAGRVFVQPLLVEGARVVRFHFTIETPVDGQWSLVLKDGRDQAMWTTSAQEQETADFWSGEIEGGLATVEIHTPTDVSGLKMVIDKAGIGGEPVSNQAITPPNQMKPITQATATVATWGRAVARLRLAASDGLYYCSGFLVSRDLLMTNQHCILNDAEMRSTEVDFDYDEGGAKRVTLKFIRLMPGDVRFLSDPVLDYALLRLDRRLDRDPLRLKDEKVATQALAIVEHPGGRPKHFSVEDCRVVQPNVTGVSRDRFTDFEHFCDTETGSSGSPVQNMTTGEVIGLHHLGFRKTSKRLVNRAVRIGLILDDIAKRQPALLPELGLGVP